MAIRFDLEQSIGEAANFTWGEVLYLRQWAIHVYPTTEQYVHLIRIASKMQWIREFFNKPVHITSGLRPDKYNHLIGGAAGSAHISGQALDFVVEGMDCDEVRAQLLPLLDHLDLRMENLPGANWCHIDLRLPGKGGRFFKP